MTSHWCRYLFRRDQHENARPSRDTVSPSCLLGWPYAVHPAVVQQVAEPLHGDVAEYLHVLAGRRFFIFLPAHGSTL